MTFTKFFSPASAHHRLFSELPRNSKSSFSSGGRACYTGNGAACLPRASAAINGDELRYPCVGSAKKELPATSCGVLPSADPCAGTSPQEPLLPARLCLLPWGGFCVRGIWWVSTAARQAAGLGYEKAFLLWEPLWSGSTSASAFKQQHACAFARKQALFIKTCTQMRKPGNMAEKCSGHLKLPVKQHAPRGSSKQKDILSSFWWLYCACVFQQVFNLP